MKKYFCRFKQCFYSLAYCVDENDICPAEDDFEYYMEFLEQEEEKEERYDD